MNKNKIKTSSKEKGPINQHKRMAMGEKITGTNERSDKPSRGKRGKK